MSRQMQEEPDAALNYAAAGLREGSKNLIFLSQTNHGKPVLLTRTQKPVSVKQTKLALDQALVTLAQSDV